MHYTFSCPNEDDKTNLENDLLELGFAHLYTIEDGENFLLGGFHEAIFDHLPFLTSIEETPNIDWHAEWALHCPYFNEGKAIIPIGNGESIEMAPGPGFGDLSHPTTRLMLEGLTSLPKGSTVVDLGSGSGILSLAAKKLGARQVTGLEIDPEAIEHARLNASLNQLSEVAFAMQMDPSKIPEDAVFLMNMTLIDQKELFSSYPSLFSHGGLWLISGVLEEQEDQLRISFPEAQKIRSLQGWGLFQA